MKKKDISTSPTTKAISDGMFSTTIVMVILRKVILFIMMVGTTLVVSTCAKREPVEEGRCSLQFKTITEHDEDALFLATQYLASTTDKPSELKDLPKNLTADYVYFLVELAGKNTPVVLASYSRLEQSMLYVDTNDDGCLSDEKPHRPQITEQPRFNRKEYRFGPISVEFSGAEGELETQFYAKTYNGQTLIVCPAGYRVGKIQLGKKTYKVAVIDGDYDGLYDGTFSLPVKDFYRPECDLFAFDANRDDRLTWGHHEVMPLSRMLRVGTTQYDTAYYSISVTPNGDSLDLKRIEPEFGMLDFGSAYVLFQVWSDGAHQILDGRPSQNWRLPAGRYIASPIEFRCVDTSGHRWIFRSSREVGRLKDFRIEPGQKTSISLGAPFSIKTSVEQKDGNALIGFGLEGQAGVLYRPGARKGKATIPAPRFKIIDELGKIIGSGQFEYG
jgi:hypothetical protein